MEKGKIFLLGMLVMAALVFMLGAGVGSEGEVGRFQPVVIVGGNSGLFMTDTKTGVTKIVWGAYKGGQLGKPFGEMDLQPK